MKAFCVFMVLLLVLVVHTSNAQGTTDYSTDPSEIVSGQTSNTGTDTSSSGAATSYTPVAGSSPDPTPNTAVPGTSPDTSPYGNTDLSTGPANTTSTTPAKPTEPNKPNLGLILGLSLGLGIPAILAVVGGIIYYFKLRKPSRKETYITNSY